MDENTVNELANNDSNNSISDKLADSTPLMVSIVLNDRRPKRIVHFSDGILEEYITDEEESREECDAVQTKDNYLDLVKKIEVDAECTTLLTWISYLWYHLTTTGTRTLTACDNVGGYLAQFFGITSPKYQYEIEEYQWMKKQQEEQMKEGGVDSWNVEKNVKEPTVESQPESRFVSEAVKML